MMTALMSALLVGTAGAATGTGKHVLMEIRDLKTGKIETRLSIPLWVAKAGGSFAQMVRPGSKDEKVDIAKLVGELEKQQQTGTFLEIEDHEGGQKVTFALD